MTLKLNFEEYPLNVFENQKCIDFFNKISLKHKKGQNSVLNPLEKSVVSAFARNMLRFSYVSLPSFFCDYILKKQVSKIQQELSVYVSGMLEEVDEDPTKLRPIMCYMAGLLYMVAHILMRQESNLVSYHVENFGHCLIDFIKKGDFSEKGFYNSYTVAYDVKDNTTWFLLGDLCRMYMLALLMNYYIKHDNHANESEIQAMALELMADDSNTIVNSLDSSKTHYYFFSRKLPVLMSDFEETDIKDFVEHNLSEFKSFVHHEYAYRSQICTLAKEYYEEHIDD